jgi:hypothetical protein
LFIKEKIFLLVFSPLFIFKEKIAPQAKIFGKITIVFIWKNTPAGAKI